MTCLAGVYIVFDGRVILGTRARKTRTKSMNAFSSIDYPDVALIRDGRILHYIRQPKPQMPPVFYDRLDAKRLCAAPHSRHEPGGSASCWPIGLTRWSSRASAWAVCPATSRQIFFPPLPHGAARASRSSSPRRCRTRAAILAVYQVGARVGRSARHFAGLHDDRRGRRHQADVDSCRRRAILRKSSGCFIRRLLAICCSLKNTVSIQTNQIDNFFPISKKRRIFRRFSFLICRFHFLHKVS